MPRIVAEKPPSPFVVSAPHAGVAAASSGTSGAFITQNSIVYVALAAGSVPGAERVTIRVQSTGATVSAPAVDGGMDPVAVAAGPDDTLHVDVRLTGSTVPVSYIMPVPRVGRPVVIRTSPPPRKRDVPLNMIVSIVFSEPITAASLTGSSVQLASGAAPVAGELAFADPTRLTSTFTPAAPLAPATDYTLTITQAILSLDGQPLAAAVTVQFTTVDQPLGPPPPPPGTGLRVTILTTGSTGSEIPDGFGLVARQCPGFSDWRVGACISQKNFGAPSNGTTTVALPPGDYVLAIGPNGLLVNCAVEGIWLSQLTSTAVTIKAGTLTDVTFNITCVRTGEIRVTAPTTGPDRGGDYWVDVDGWVAYGFNGEGSISIPLGAGLHAITLIGVPSNCTFAGANPVWVTVTAGATTDVSFPLSCAPNPTLRITVTTSGANFPIGYTIGVDFDSEYSLSAPVNGVVSLQKPPGTLFVYLVGVPANCTVSTANPISAVLTLGTTTDVAFAVVCH